MSKWLLDVKLSTCFCMVSYIHTIYHKSLVGEKFGENVKNSIWQIKFGKNVKILTIVVEL